MDNAPYTLFCILASMATISSVWGAICCVVLGVRAPWSHEKDAAKPEVILVAALCVVMAVGFFYCAFLAWDCGAFIEWRI